MTVSTRGRYALRVMVDLAEHGGEGFIPLKAITERQNISQKYLEGIMASLSKAGLVEGACLKSGAEPCELADRCRTFPMWRELNRVINEFFDSYTIADLMVKDGEYNNWII